MAFADVDGSWLDGATSVDDDDTEDASEEDDQDEEDNEDTNGTEDDEEIDTEDEDYDPCDGVEADSCSDKHDEDTGEQLCALNIATNDCYEIVQSRGIYGKGNFDDGYSAAQQETDAATQQLNTVVGVMGGFIAVLVLIIVAGGYWVYSKQRKHIEVEMDDDDDHYRPRVQRLDTAEDAEPMISN